MNQNGLYWFWRNIYSFCIDWLIDDLTDLSISYLSKYHLIEGNETEIERKRNANNYNI